MASTWTPPKDGTPCWINVLATDVKRAKKFYSEVFNWKFPTREAHHGKPLDENEIAMFEAPGQPCPGGGITRVPQEEWAANRHGLSRKGVVLYLYVEDIKLWEEKITSNGGKKMTGIEPEGEMALMQHFEDTEGNYFGIYSMKK